MTRPAVLVRALAAVAFVAGVAAAVTLSLATGGEPPPFGLGSLRMPPPHPWDKLLHVAAYAVLTGLALLLVPAGRPWRWSAAAAVLVLATVLEVQQGTVAGRTASLADALANLVGVVLGVVAVRR